MPPLHNIQQVLFIQQKYDSTYYIKSKLKLKYFFHSVSMYILSHFPKMSVSRTLNNMYLLNATFNA